MAKKTKANALAVTQLRGMAVTPAEASAYPFDHVDVRICESLLAGRRTSPEIAQDLGVTLSVVEHRLHDPVRCAWISQQLQEAVQSRLGNVIAAVYNRAVATGDPRSATFLRDTLTPFVKKDRHEHLHLHGQVDLSRLTDEQLAKLIEDQQSKRGVHHAQEPAGPGAAVPRAQGT